MQDNREYRYFAFISYNSKDKKIVEKIHQRIVNFPLPTVLRNELEAKNGKECPASVSPLFLDIANLPAGQLLAETIIKELNDSRFLLVICSPNSAKSDWVNQEVENFILMGRYDRIIPYIIKGVPNSENPKTECFPPILRKKRVFITYPILSNEENAKRHANLHAFLDSIHDELRGVSLSGEGSENSLMKIIARMLEIRPDVFIDLCTQQQKIKKEQAKKKKVPWLLIIASFFLLLCSCLGFAAWDRYYRIHVDYYADYVEQWGVPKGIFPLSANQTKHRYEHYRIYTQNQKVIRLEHVNAVGTPIPVANTEFNDRPMIAEYYYTTDGALFQQSVLDNNKNVILRRRYSGNQMQKVEIILLPNNNIDSSTTSIVSSNIASLTNSKLDSSQEEKRVKINNMRLIRDSEGRVIEQLFQSAFNIPITDERGIAGFRYKLDAFGRVNEKTYLDQNGAPCPDKYGVVYQSYIYNQENLIEIRYLDKDKNPAPNEYGWWYCFNSFSNGNVTTKFVDVSGKIYQTIEYTYNNRGDLIKAASLDIGGKPRLNKDGFAIITCEYNDLGFPVELAYHGLGNKPCLNKNGVAKVNWICDEKGNMFKESYSDADGRPCLCNEGFASLTNKYNDQGFVIEQNYYNAAGEPCFHEDGYAKRCMEYDREGKVTNIAFFNTDNELCLNNEAYAKRCIQYDERGDIISEMYLDTYGYPCLGCDGYASFHTKYDLLGNKTEIVFYNIDGMPCMCADGYAKATWEYDQQGNQTKEAYFGIDDKPCCLAGSYPYTRWEGSYYKNGSIAKQTFYFTIKPYKNVLGKWALEYDENGNIASTCFMDMNDQPCLCADGYYKKISTYNQQGNQTQVAYYGVDDKPCLYKDELSIIKSKYDNQGNITELAYFDINGKPCIGTNGFAKVTMEFDDRGNQIKESYFDADGKTCCCTGEIPFTGWEIVYHENGNVAKRIQYFTIKPLKNVLGAWVMEYDEQGNTILVYSLDLNNQPCLCDDGYAKKTKTYDINGNNVEEAYFGVDDKPCLFMDGYAKVAKKYDAQGNMIEVTFFGVDGKPCQHKDGFAKIMFENDDQGKETKKTYYDLNGKKLTFCVSVQEVNPDSNCKKYGIQQGDFFILYDGQPVEDYTSFIEKRSKETDNDPHELVILRNNEFVTIQIHPGLLGCLLEPKELSDDQQKLVSEKLEEVKNN